MENAYAALRLENQLCFPLYACSREIIKQYKPHLDELGLTYTQYITMMVLWEKGEATVKELGEQLYLEGLHHPHPLQNRRAQSDDNRYPGGHGAAGAGRLRPGKNGPVLPP